MSNYIKCNKCGEEVFIRSEKGECCVKLIEEDDEIRDEELESLYETEWTYKCKKCGFDISKEIE